MRSMFKAYFKDFIHSSNERKESPIGQIPLDYSYCKLGDFVKFSQGTQVPVEEQYFLEQVEPNDSVRFIRIVDYTTHQKETPRYIRKSNKQCFCTKDEVTMVRYGNVGLVGRRIEGVIANNIFKIIPENGITNDFLYYFLSQQSVYEFIVASCGGSAMPSIKHSTIADLGFVLPPIELVNEFSKVAKEVEKIILLNQKEIVLLQRENSFLLAALLSH